MAAVSDAQGREKVAIVTKNSSSTGEERLFHSKIVHMYDNCVGSLMYAMTSLTLLRHCSSVYDYLITHSRYRVPLTETRQSVR